MVSTIDDDHDVSSSPRMPSARVLGRCSFMGHGSVPWYRTLIRKVRDSSLGDDWVAKMRCDKNVTDAHASTYLQGRIGPPNRYHFGCRTLEYEFHVHSHDTLSTWGSVEARTCARG